MSDALHEPGLPPLQGVGLAVFVTSVALVALSTLVVGLRVYIRWLEKSIWWDDALMLSGLILYIGDVYLSCKATHAGLGLRNIYLTQALQTEAKMYMTIWTIAYTACLVLVKSSICMTMLRLTVSMKHTRFSVHALLFFCVANFFILFVGTLAQCRPVAANWDRQLFVDGKAWCGSDRARMGISYASTVLTIATDVGCAILPAVILWSTRLKVRTKLLVSLLLSFGSLASVCTMIRSPYIKYYQAEDLVYWIGYVILWSNIETAIGLVAGSIPVLQKLIMGYTKKPNCSGGGDVPHIIPGLVTFGSSPLAAKSRSQRVFHNPTDTGFSVASVHASRRSHEWERLEDDSSGSGIRADFTYEVELSRVQTAKLP